LVNYRHWYPPWSDEKPAPSLTESGAAALPSPYDEVARAAVGLRKHEVPVLSESARELVTAASAENEEHRLFRVAIDQYVPVSVDDDIRWLLANTKDSDAAVKAIEAGIRRGMTKEIHAALSHRFS